MKEFYNLILFFMFITGLVGIMNGIRVARNNPKPRSSSSVSSDKELDELGL